MTTLHRAALATGLLLLSATGVDATTIAPSGDEDDKAVLIVNNYTAPVEIFAENTSGESWKLGRVGRGELKEIAVPSSLAGENFRIEVYPTHPGSLLQYDEFAVRSGLLNVESEGQIVFWVERNITKSLVQRVLD